jgi:uncharacterized damage-inducible protein DinB
MTHAILIRLARSREKLLALVSDLSEEALDQRLPDGWTIRSALTHLLNAEEDHCRISAVIASGEIERLPPTVDIDTYNAERLAARGRLSRAELFAALAAQRERTVALFNRLTEDQLTQSGPHPAFGEMTAANVFRIIAVHEQRHMRDIAALLETQKGVP